MSVVITGATGFLGQNILEAFAEKGISTIGLSRRAEPGQGIYFTDYSVSSLIETFEGASAVVHLAASRPYSNCSSFNSNVALDESVFKAAREARVTNVVFASSRGVYGSGHTPWRESLAVDPINAYATAKYESELLGHELNKHGMKIKMLRLAQLLGVGEQEQSVIPTFIRNCLANKPVVVTVSGISREYIYVKDVASAIYTAVSKPSLSGVFNVGSGEINSLTDIANQVCLAAGKPELLTLDISKNLDEYSIMDSSKFQTMFGWKPQYSLERALKEMIEIMGTERQFD